MYGFIHCAWADMVATDHGNETWQDILNESGLELGGGSFLTHKCYMDEDTRLLMEITARKTGTTMDKCLRRFGQFFVQFCMKSGYSRVLQFLGNNLLDFLSNLDALHDHFEAAYPSMRAPSFRCRPTHNGNLILHYYSRRDCLHHMVIGAVTEIAKSLFDTDVIVERIDNLVPMAVKHCHDGNDGGKCVTLSIREENPFGLSTRKRSSSLVCDLGKYRHSTRTSDLPIGVETFSKVFPFHVMFNSEMEIVQLGISMKRIINCMTDGECKGRKFLFGDIFNITRPIISCTFKSILEQITTLFMVTTKFGVKYSAELHDRLVNESKREDFGWQNDLIRSNGQSGELVHSIPSSSRAHKCLRLKGQMTFLPESDCVLFLCSPRVSTLDELQASGIFLSDIPLHDVTRDLILTCHARRHERVLVEKLEETSNNLKKLQCQLEEDTRKTDDLLHSILPAHVAKKLRLNQSVEAETFDRVTILFSDIVGFTGMCGDDSVVAIDIVRMLNRLYTHFDMLTSLNDVYKVETIGDAYMVVGGLPSPGSTDADQVVAMAFGMLEVANSVLSPVDDKPIQIRIGIHSGSCVAGVVGQKMPRYCLFGHTVSLASRMEALSLPGKVNISDTTARLLNQHSNYLLEVNEAGESVMPCFFVHQTPSSPRPVMRDLSLPMPMGMFRTPNPTPTVTPSSSPLQLSPVKQTSAEPVPQFLSPTTHLSGTENEALYAGGLSPTDTHINHKLSLLRFLRIDSIPDDVNTTAPPLILTVPDRATANSDKR